MVVQRACRKTGGDRHALEQAGSGVGHPLGQRLLVDIDLIAVNARASPAVCENPIRTRATAATAAVPGVIHISSSPGSRPRAASRYVADQRHAARAEVEQPRCQQPTDDETRAPGTPGAIRRRPKTTTSAGADPAVAWWT